MDLLQEAKNSNRQAYSNLILKYNHIFYKTAMVFLFDDKYILKAFKNSFSKVFLKLNTISSEQDFLILSLKILISNCKQLKRKYSKKKQEKELCVNITETISFAETSVAFEEYQKYRNKSIVEEIITSIDEEYRLISVLYYYANLSPVEIAIITKIPENTIIQKINSVRIKIYEIIKTKEVDW